MSTITIIAQMLREMLPQSATEPTGPGSVGR